MLVHRVTTAAYIPFRAWPKWPLKLSADPKGTPLPSTTSESSTTASTGNSLSFVPASSQNTCLDLNLPSNQSNPVYASFLLKITDLTAVPTTAANNPFAAFGDDPTPNPGAQIARLGARVLTKKVGSGYVLGTSKSATTTDFLPCAASKRFLGGRRIILPQLSSARCRVRDGCEQFEFVRAGSILPRSK